MTEQWETSWAALARLVVELDSIRYLEPVVGLAAADPVLGRLYPYTAHEELHVSRTTTLEGHNELAYLWPETKFLYRHAFRRIGEGPDQRVVIFRHGHRLSEFWQEDLTAPLSVAESQRRFWELEAEWDDIVARDPTFTIMPPYRPGTRGVPLTVPLPSAEAVATWSEIVAGQLRGLED